MKKCLIVDYSLFAGRLFCYFLHIPIKMETNKLLSEMLLLLLTHLVALHFVHKHCLFDKMTGS